MPGKLYDRICHIVLVQLGITEIQPGDRLVEDLGAESADVVNIISTLEDRLNVVLEEETIARISTVADLTEAFEELDPSGDRNASA
jgi:acyl carrier protein